MNYTEASDKDRSLTNEEYFALHGTLNRARIESLLEMELKVEDQGEAISHIEEAEGRFPKEVHLNEAINDLRAVLKNLQGDCEEDVEHVILRLELIQERMGIDSKYALEALEKAKDAIWVP